MTKQNVFIGFLTGIAANIAGVFIYISLFSAVDIDATLADALENNYLGKIVAIGAILNFIPFFVFLRKKQAYHARGVLLATVVAAIGIGVYKFI